MTTTKIDLTKPVEAVNTLTGAVVQLGRAALYTPNYRRGKPDLIQTAAVPDNQTSNDLWELDGTDHCYLKRWILRNVAEAPSIPVGTKLYYPSYPADIVRAASVVGASLGGKAIAETDDGLMHRIDPVTLKDLYDYQWSLTNPGEAVVVYRNIYADGTIGETAHKSKEVCEAATKYGKVAVGVLMQKTAGGKVIDALVTSRTPQLRRRGGVIKHAFS